MNINKGGQKSVSTMMTRIVGFTLLVVTTKGYLQVGRTALTALILTDKLPNALHILFTAYTVYSM